MRGYNTDIDIYKEIEEIWQMERRALSKILSQHKFAYLRLLLDIGKGMLVLVQKPGKPTGPLKSLRPIVLLSVLRKTLSLIVLSRIAPKFDDYLSSSQSGFRRGRSTADVV